MRKNLVFIVDDPRNLGDALIAQTLLMYSKQALGAERVWLALPSAPPAAMSDRFAALGAETITIGSPFRMFLDVCRRADVFVGSGQVVRESVTEKRLVAMLVATLLTRFCGGAVSLVGAGATPIRNLRKRLLW